MFRTTFAVLAPVVLLLLLCLNVESKSAAQPTTLGNKLSTSAPTVKITTKSATIAANASHGNESTTQTTTAKSSPIYHTPNNYAAMLKRLVYVTLVLSAVIGLYFLVRFCRSAKRKPRKYGVVKTDMETRPLESDDDDDEDITMFNRKN